MSQIVVYILLIFLNFNIGSIVTNCIILFCCFVEIKKIPLWSLFLIVYLHLQWNAVLTQIYVTEAVLRNSRYF